MADNRVPLSYSGGAAIDAFRAAPGTIAGPEDWVGSVWELPAQFARGEGRADWGVSHLPDGRTLRAAIAEDPDGWLGATLAGAIGTPGVLVKLLDAGERLPVHFHPTDAFARRNLGSRYGKTEGWVILDARPGAAVWLGFREEVGLETVRRWVARQDHDAMLAAMNRRDVTAGDAIYVPAGVPHAFGPGILMCELQEPTSFSIHMEHARFGMDDEVATLGLGWETALEELHRRSFAARVGECWAAPWIERTAGESRAEHLFPQASLPFFDAQRLTVRGELALGPPTFGVLVVLAGEGRLRAGDGEQAVAGGQTWVVPHAAGPCRLAGEVEALLCLPPAVGGGTPGS
ncbi:class I mannose-6-phosphate isomerase [Conexibacter arvalis]|uniref:Mannose-6-phosphate isomerase n=1 Tax=Conexibacter arvalis TaxID=912552 RepID=A0A840ICF2_9ACTN|nr:class I mannose-6-phosphate isomerase [Conexibacter arvalis]MBB4662412.1 mannose-6-phosphate isomerase [Conexibacter arvalis]